MYAVDDPVKYAGIMKSDLPDAVKKIELLQYRHQRLNNDVYVSPFKENVVVQGKDQLVATFESAGQAALFSLFMRWWPMIYGFINAELLKKEAGDDKPA